MGRYLAQIPVAPAGGIVNGKRLSHGILLSDPSFVGLLEVNRGWTDPEQSEGGVANLVEQRDVLDGRVVHASASANACFSRTAREFRDGSIRCSRRIGNSQPRRKAVVLSRS